jgi:hypothetical protein
VFKFTPHFTIQTYTVYGFESFLVDLHAICKLMDVSYLCVSPLTRELSFLGEAKKNKEKAAKLE